MQNDFGFLPDEAPLIDPKSMPAKPPSSFPPSVQSTLNADAGANDFGFKADNDPSSMPGFSKSATVKQEAPKDLTEYDRWIAQNFSTSPQASVSQLQAKYPDYDVAHDGKQLLMRKKGEDQWSALDPKYDYSGPLKFANSILKSGAHTVSDNIVPFAQGAVSNAVAGATGAAVATTGAAPAAIPAAMLAGGATNAGLEALKAKVGSYLGLPQGINTKDEITAGIGGALNPLLFGTGGSAANIAANAAEQGLSKAATQTAINSQRGVLPAIAAPIAGFLSGIPADTLRTAATRMPEIANMEKNGVTSLASSAADSFNNNLSNATKDVGKKIGQALDDSKNPVDLSGAKKAFQDRIDQLQSLYEKSPTPATEAELKQAQGSYSSLFGDNTADEIPNEVDGPVAMNLLQQLKEHAGILGRQSIGAQNAQPVAVKQLQNASKNAYGDLSGQIDDALSDTGGEGLRSQYKSLKDLQENIGPLFSDPSKTYNTLRTMGSKNKKVLFESLQGVDQNLGTNLIDDAKLLDAYGTFADPKLTSGSTPLSQIGTGGGYLAGAEGGDSHSYAIPKISSMIGSAIGKTVGSPAAIRYAGMPAARAAQFSSPAIPSIWDALMSRHEQNDVNNPERKTQ